MLHHDSTEYPESPCQTGKCIWVDKVWGWIGSTRREMWCDECVRQAFASYKERLADLKEHIAEVHRVACAHPIFVSVS
jgi:hypothetical protein